MLLEKSMSVSRNTCSECYRSVICPKQDWSVGSWPKVMVAGTTLIRVRRSGVLVALSEATEETRHNHTKPVARLDYDLVSTRGRTTIHVPREIQIAGSAVVSHESDAPKCAANVHRDPIQTRFSDFKSF